MSREDPHFRLRFPDDLRARVEESARANKRSMTAEILARLEQTFASEPSLEDTAAVEAALREQTRGLVADVVGDAFVEAVKMLVRLAETDPDQPTRPLKRLIRQMGSRPLSEWPRLADDSDKE